MAIIKSHKEEQYFLNASNREPLIICKGESVNHPSAKLNQNIWSAIKPTVTWFEQMSLRIDAVLFHSMCFPFCDTLLNYPFLNWMKAASRKPLECGHFSY